MIRKLKTRLILMVVTALALASAILVLAINWMNVQSLTRQTENVLAMLAENGGQRPALQERSKGASLPEKPLGTPPREQRDRRGNLPDREIRNAADFSNYYLVHLNEDGSVTIPEALRPYMGGKEKLEPVK